MGAGLFSNDSDRNKNFLFIQTLTIMILLVFVVLYGMYRLTQSGKTYREQVVASGDRWF